MDLSAPDRSARTLFAYESDFKAVLIPEESLLPVMETHQVQQLLHALTHLRIGV